MAAISLGAAVAKAACGIWLGDSKLASDVGASVVDLAAQRLTSAREQRQFRRVWDQAAELIADRVEPLVEREFRGVPEHERIAAVDAVRDTFEAAALTEDDLFRQDLDAGYLDRYLRGQDPARVSRAALSPGAVALYDLVLRECCAYTIEVARGLPGATVAGIAELLRRERQIVDDVAAVLERLPARRGVADFERDYGQLVANRFDQVEFFGATLTESSRRYPLSVAYLSLTMTARRPEGDAGEPGSRTVRVEEVLARTRRLFVRGQAGLGKTTLLHWIAVQGARGSFETQLAGWNDTVPFFVPLRRYATTDLPGPEEFIREVGRHISDEMPPAWVHEQLRGGRATVLVDGIDELAEERRGPARQWLADLVATFPHARYVVTSRPAAVPPEWLGAESFEVAELEPMDHGDIPIFVHRWHEAVRSGCRTDEERAEVTELEEHLLASLDTHRHLRQLAGFPLLCALLCALHRDRRADLPGNRMELYDVALRMLLERRDAERRIVPHLSLSRTEKSLLLQDLAYWLIRNEWSDAAREAVVDRLAGRLRAMPQVTAGAEPVFRVLLERSGLLREPVDGRIDFVHRTFQEYLAAKQATDDGDIGVLVSHAHLAQWHEVVVMAAGHATPPARAALLKGLMKRGNKWFGDAAWRDTVRLVALACMETSPERPPEIDEEIRATAGGMIPPRDRQAADALGQAGELALDLLARAPVDDDSAQWTIRALSMAGNPAAMPLLARFGGSRRSATRSALVSAWGQFDPDEYARLVLRESVTLQLSDPRVYPAVRHLELLEDLDYDPGRRDPGSFAVDLRAVRSLRRLQRLRVPSTNDLSPLAGLPLRFLELWLSTSGSTLDLRPLREMRHLRKLDVAGAVTGSESLSHLTELRHLSIDATAVEGLAEAKRRPPLIDLTMRGRTDAGLLLLRPWADTLVTLALAPTVQDLAPLANLHRVTDLTLTPWFDVDLTHVAAMPSLTLLSVHFFGRFIRGGPDLTPLAGCPGLCQLRIGGYRDIDLSPLAGRLGFVVYVEAPTQVRGDVRGLDIRRQRGLSR